MRSIAGTRDAYNLEEPNVEEREPAVSAVPLTREDLDKSAATMQNVRIWDWGALESQLQQIQGLQPYYSFSSVDIDRYMIDDVERQVMITAHEQESRSSPIKPRSGSIALKYTHGDDVVAVAVNEMDSRKLNHDWRFGDLIWLGSATTISVTAATVNGWTNGRACAMKIVCSVGRGTCPRTTAMTELKSSTDAGTYSW